MQKILAFTFKELITLLRDRTAFLLTLVAPLILTAVMGFAFGGFSGGGTGLARIPLVVVNDDAGSLGKALVNLLTSEALSALLNPTLLTDAAEGRAQVDADKMAAVVIIPANLTQQVMDGEQPTIDVYVNPGRPISAGVVRGIVERFAQQVAAGMTGATVTIEQLISSGRLAPQEAATTAPQIGERVALQSVERQLIAIKNISPLAETGDSASVLNLFAPGIAILFLMFTMAASARSLLNEQQMGTLARLRSTPTSGVEILAGKISGTLFIGLLQMTVLIAATSLMMGVQWGNPVGVAIHTLLTVTAIASMGLVIASFARSAGQANAIGSAVVMVLAAIGGNFIPRGQYPPFLQTLSLIGPNAWGIEGYQKLAQGATLSGLVPEMIALSLMTVVFFTVALIGFRKLVR